MTQRDILLARGGGGGACAVMTQLTVGNRRGGPHTHTMADHEARKKALEERKKKLEDMKKKRELG